MWCVVTEGPFIPKGNVDLRSMCREWQPKVTAIKESNDLSTLDITNLFGKLVEHENELKRLADNEVSLKNKEKGKEEKQDLSLKVSSSKMKKSKEKSEYSNEEVSRKE